MKISVSAADPNAVFLTPSEPVKQALVPIFASAKLRWPNASEELDAGELTLLNSRQQLGNPIDWSTRMDVPHLWQFQLQYHEFLLAIADSHPGQTWDCIAGWIDSFQPNKTAFADDSWHPYCISRRLIAWSWLVTAVPPPKQLESALLESYCQQMEFLRNNLETDLGGNHLLENLFALGIAACVVDSSQSNELWKYAISAITEQLDAQILPYGEHFERSPMYHCHILGNLLLLQIFANNQPGGPRECCHLAKTTEAMSRFLDSILHPDNDIPLFADSCFEEGISVAATHSLRKILDNAQFGPSKSKPESPYEVFEIAKSSSHLIVDFGEVGCPSLPAHAHCDLFNFELSVDGHRWIVDSGNYDYEDSKVREYCRSSRAHNVAIVDGRNHCDVWGKFRMGRYGTVTRRSNSCDGRFTASHATHNAYRKDGCNSLSRTVMVDSRDGSIAISDYCGGTRNYDLTGFIHFSPDVTVSDIGTADGWQFIRASCNGALRYVSTQAANCELFSAWYCPQFGVKRENRAFAYSDRVRITLIISTSPPHTCSELLAHLELPTSTA